MHVEIANTPSSIHCKPGLLEGCSLIKFSIGLSAYFSHTLPGRYFLQITPDITKQRVVFRVIKVSNSSPLIYLFFLQL